MTIDYGEVLHVRDSVATVQFASRPARQPDHAAENKALVALTHELAESPTTILQKLVDTAMALTSADSAGISIAQMSEGRDVFRWQATAGELARYRGQTIPRDASPCGTVLERNAAQLMLEPARAFPALARIQETIYEALLVPFHRGDTPIGTVWILSHRPELKFDAEDCRLVSSIARFASAAVKTLGDLDALTLTTRNLRNAQARLESALEAGSIGTFSWDVVNDRVTADRHLTALFPVSPENAAGGPIAAYIAVLHPDDKERIVRLIQGALEHGDVFEAESRQIPAEGAVRWLVARGKVSRDASGRAIDISGALVDITERKLAELQQREADRRKTEFLATLAHELRNPLAPIRTGLELLKRAGLSGSGNDTREMMERQVGHMVRLIDDLLDLSRISQGKIELRRQSTELRSIIDNAIEASLPGIEGARHTLSVALPDEPLPVDADLVRLAQVFSNLLTNAAKYTPDGGHIGLSAARAGDSVVVRVTDDGIGLAPESVSSIFEMFGQVDGTRVRAQGGLGIGLALARRFTEMHGGTLVAASAGLGQGSTFSVELPLATAATGAVGDEDARAAAGQTLPPRFKILVVEDNVDGAESLALLLSLNGHDVRIEHTGHAGLQTAHTFLPAVVFLDIGLPDINGCDVARQLRADSRFRTATLIALTGWGGDDDRRQTAQAGFDHHLTKPVEPARIDDILAKRRPD